MVIVTHEMSFAKNVSTRVLFMDKGEIIEDTNPLNYLTIPKTKELKTF